jgi:hypothetical protein
MRLCCGIIAPGGDLVWLHALQAVLNAANTLHLPDQNMKTAATKQVYGPFNSLAAHLGCIRGKLVGGGLEQRPQQQRPRQPLILAG